jgi:hypothetical protein
MRRSANRAYSAAALAISAIALQGCVAAAFPIAAGGLLGERSLSGSSDEAPTIDATVEVASATSSDEITNSDLTPLGEESNGATPPATAGRADFNAAFAATQNAPPSSFSNGAEPLSPAITAPSKPPAALAASTVATASSAEPASEIVRPLPTPVPSVRQPLGPPEINQLLSYANGRQINSEEEPASAMLSDRLSLAPTKAQCGGVSPTILIDLDPEGGQFDPLTASRPPSGLARGLAQLRLRGVSVAWISSNSVDKLDSINRTLALSGLDINNEDRILLVRNNDDRKQTLREELAQISCLIAIAGDTRSDFDELYDYLKNPSDADSLEPLIGDGWFLIPQPLL